MVKFYGAEIHRVSVVYTPGKCVRACVHMSQHEYIHVDTHIHACGHIYMHVDTYIHTCGHIYMHVDMQMYNYHSFLHSRMNCTCLWNTAMRVPYGPSPSKD